MTGRGGVFYMYYTGANTETVVTPEGIPGLESGIEMEGLRLRPGLAMSQVRGQQETQHPNVWPVSVYSAIRPK